MAGALKRKTRGFFGFPESTETEDAYDTEFNEFDDYEELGAVTPLHRPAPVVQPEADIRRIVTVHPTSYNEARVIGEAFREGTPVIINVTTMSKDEARRLVDFASGLIFGLRGSLERVTDRVFLLSPAEVEVCNAQTPQGDELFIKH